MNRRSRLIITIVVVLSHWKVLRSRLQLWCKAWWVLIGDGSLILSPLHCEGDRNSETVSETAAWLERKQVS